MMTKPFGACDEITKSSLVRMAPVGRGAEGIWSVSIDMVVIAPSGTSSTGTATSFMSDWVMVVPAGIRDTVI